MSHWTVSTKEEANEIALPLAQTYAQKNNYTISTITTTLRETTKPYWLIETEFEPTKIAQYAINNETITISYAYEVTVWADTGKIYHHSSITINPLTNAPNLSKENVKITVDEAIEIALPLAQTYAQKNNRTITTIHSTCNLDSYLDSRPWWQITIGFEDGERIGSQMWVAGYTVRIWGDTGEIQDTQTNMLL
jgi:antitoxin component of RelBE/YafQ-DinJ toxin-antitoxin module